MDTTPEKTHGHRPEDSFAARIIEWSVQHRVFVVLGMIVLVVWGALSVSRIPLDAIPDLSDTQVIIRTDFEGQAPQIIEDQITYPLATQMLSVPRAKVVRGTSMMGTSFLYIIFEEGTDIYWARSRVLEALSVISGRLPQGVTPQLGPDATGVGWVYQYALLDRTGTHDLSALRSLQDWFVRFELAMVDGVSEVASVGGFVKEYQVLVDPERLRAHGVSLTHLSDVVRAASGETGGRTMEMAETEYLVRALGYVQNPEDIAQAVLRVDSGTPLRVGDVARVVEGASQRRGIVDLNGEGEVVGGIVVMRSGYNALHVIDAIKTRLAEIQAGLPEGVEVVTVYDRSDLIQSAVHYLTQKLIEESLVVALVVFLFLLHVRSACVALVTLPLGILAAFIVMDWQGISANIMSLGGIAIAIGTMVDASIVMVENAHHHLSRLPANASRKTRRAVLVQSMKEVGPGLFFSLLIITVSFLPVFALTGQSGRLFAPLGYTNIYAMAAASFLSVTVVPVLMLWFVRGRIRREEENPVNRVFSALYRPLLEAVLHWPKVTLVLGALVLMSTALPLSKLGTEFMPPLNEGSLLYMPMTVPSVSPAKAREILQITNRMIMDVPEVKQVFGKAGRADTATDPAPLAMIESWIELHPKAQWRKGMTMDMLIAELDEKVRLPGMVNSWGYPIRIRLDMLSTGIRTPVGIKISAPDLETIDTVSRAVEELARGVPGTRSAVADRVSAGKYIEIDPDRAQMARYGVSLETLQAVVATALGGMPLGEAVEGRERYTIMVRYDRPYREHLDDLDSVYVPAAEGAQIPLADLAHIRVTEGASMIRSEDARLNGWVFVDVGDRDIGSYIEDMRKALQESSIIPKGVSLGFAGQFEQMQEAAARLAVAIPLTLLIIVVLLYVHYGRWDSTAMIFATVPFAVSGGVWCVWLAGYHLSVAVAIGFIALAGVAVETAVVTIIYIDQRMRENPPRTFADLVDNVRRGALLRLRPNLMTDLTIIIGLMPVFLVEGTGADVMRRIALPLMGGMVSVFFMALIVLPALYVVWVQARLRLSR